MQSSSTESKPKINILEFPKDFQITPEWVEKIDNINLLILSLSNTEQSSLMKSLIETKIKILKSEGNPDPSFAFLGGTEKDTGNTLMKSKNFQEAIMHYTYAAIYNPKESAIYCNRALAYINQSNYNKAILDCTRAIALNPNYIKAYYRRATCYSKLNKYQLALEDLFYLLNTGNGSKEIETEINNTLNAFKNAVGNDNWSKLNKDIQEQLKEAKGKTMEEKEFSWNLSQKKKEAFKQWEETSKKVKGDLDNIIKEKNFVKAETLIKTCFDQCEKFKENFNEKTTERESIVKAMYELNTMKVLIDLQLSKRIKEEEEKNNQGTKPKVTHDRFFKTTILSKDQREKATKIAEKDVKFEDYGGNAYGYERAFNSFKNRIDIFFEFMKYFGGKKISQVYTNSEIPIAVLNGTILALKQNFGEIEKNTELYFDYLQSLPKSKSFGLVKNFIKKADKAEIEKMLLKIAELDPSKKEECENIIKEYK
ncbi:MAG: tetratricopeptide repeat protein [archaeon]|nr:tetratricopeptide repeat protein [archaeon]